MDNVADITVAILRDIREEIRATNSRLDAMHEGLGARLDATNEGLGARLDATNDAIGATNARLADLTSEVRNGFAAVNTRFDGVNARIDGTNSRLDNVIKIVGEHHGELEVRVARIEEHLALR